MLSSRWLIPLVPTTYSTVYSRVFSLAILLPPVSIGAALEYEANDGIVWPTALVIFVVYFATNAIGAKLGRKHDTSQFLFWLGVLLSGIAAVLIGKHILS